MKPIGSIEQINKKNRYKQGSNLNQLRNYWLYVFLALGACTILPIIIYSHALRAPFLFDDGANIVQNPDIKDLRNIRTRLIYRQSSNDPVNRNYPTRPLTYLTFTLNYHFNQLNPFGYRITNLVIHILTGILMLFFTKKTFYYVFGKRHILFPLLASLLFLSHPMNIDPVLYIVTRSDSLATFFYFLSILLFVKAFETNQWYYAFSLTSFIFSFASKQIAATLPLMVFLYDYFFIANLELKKVWERKFYHLGFWIILFGFIAFFKFIVGDWEFMGSTWSRYIYFLFQPYAVLNYIKLLLIPVGQSIDHFPNAPKSIFEVKTFLSFVALSMIAISLFFVFKKCLSKNSEEKYNKPHLKLLLFGLFWFFITLLPTSSFFPINEPMADRRVYLPVWGFCMFLIILYTLFFRLDLAGQSQTNNHWAKMSALLIVPLGALSILTWQRSQLYREPIRLWEEAVNQYSRNPRSYYNIGKIYSENKENDKAIEFYDKALKANPNYFKALVNLGSAYYEAGNLEKAVDLLEEAIRVNPNYSYSSYNLGLIYFKTKQYSKALPLFLKLKELSPNDEEVYSYLGQIYFFLKDYAKAEEFLKHHLVQKPEDVEMHIALGQTYYALKDYKKAVEQYEAAYQLSPNDKLLERDLSILKKLFQKK